VSGADFIQSFSMAFSYLCPCCGKAVTVKSLPAGSCPHCGAALPDALKDEVERQFKPERPLSLAFQMYLGLVVGVCMLPWTPDAFAKPDDSAYRLASELVGMRIPPPPHVTPVLSGILWIFQALLLFWSSVSLYRNEAKSRMLLLVMVALFTVPGPVLTAPFVGDNPIGRAMYAAGALTALLCLLLAYLYLYHTPYSKRYYAALRYLEGRRSRPTV
jgi:hypothetical protein